METSEYGIAMRNFAKPVANSGGKGVNQLTELAYFRFILHTNPKHVPIFYNVAKDAGARRQGPGFRTLRNANRQDV